MTWFVLSVIALINWSQFVPSKALIYTSVRSIQLLQTGIMGIGESTGTSTSIASSSMSILFQTSIYEILEIAGRVQFMTPFDLCRILHRSLTLVELQGLSPFDPLYWQCPYISALRECNVKKFCTRDTLGKGWRCLPDGSSRNQSLQPVGHSHIQDYLQTALAIKYLLY